MSYPRKKQPWSFSFLKLFVELVTSFASVLTFEKIERNYLAIVSYYAQQPVFKINLYSVTCKAGPKLGRLVTELFF
jgi:hypothetical protein